MMVKTKTTPRKSDAKGRLPPLAPQWQKPKEEWGTAAEMFHKRLTLPMDVQQGDVSYKGTTIVMSNTSKMSYFLKIDLVHFLFSIEYSYSYGRADC